MTALAPWGDGPSIREPVEVAGADADWQRPVEDLDACGVAVVHARLAGWRPPDPRAGGTELRGLLGREWHRYLAIADPEIRGRFAASRLLLKHAAGAVLGGDPKELELGYGPTGRPYLRGCDQIDISLSHTEDLLLVGLTSRGLIGVDAERASRPMYRSGLGRRVCTQAELASLTGLPEEERDAALVRLWTLKEAYSKAIGQGMRFRFTEFGFTASGFTASGVAPNGRPVRLEHPDGTVCTADEWSFRTFAPAAADGRVLSVAVYDTGFGRTTDIALPTLLDSSSVQAIQRVLARTQ